jgi:hypothetical protein
MNERIRELFIQKFGKRNFPKDNAEVLMSAEDLAKFAELIVRECARIVNENDCEGSIVGDGMLFEHFGVEE